MGKRLTVAQQTWLIQKGIRRALDARGLETFSKGDLELTEGVDGVYRVWATVGTPWDENMLSDDGTPWEFRRLVSETTRRRGLEMLAEK